MTRPPVQPVDHIVYDVDTALDIVLFYTDQIGAEPDWFSVRRDFQLYLGLDSSQTRVVMEYIRNNKDILYESR